jgi:hypothetical protein
MEAEGCRRHWEDAVYKGIYMSLYSEECCDAVKAARRNEKADLGDDRPPVARR